MNEGINLLAPNKNSSSSSQLRRMNLMRLCAMGFLFLVSLSAIVLFILVALSPLPELQRQEQSLRVELGGAKDKLAQVALLEERTDSMQTIIKKRTSINTSLETVQKLLPSDMSINAISADAQITVITLESASLDSLDSFIKTLTENVQKSNTYSYITLSNMLTDDTRDTYIVTLTLGVISNEK